MPVQKQVPFNKKQNGVNIKVSVFTHKMLNVGVDSADKSFTRIPHKHCYGCFDVSYALIHYHLPRTYCQAVIQTAAAAFEYWIHITLARVYLYHFTVIWIDYLGNFVMHEFLAF
jgi:hypothetical protein